MGAATLDAEIMRVACPCCRPVMRSLLRRHAGQRIYLSRRTVERPEHVRLAGNLLATMGMADARDALMTRTGCSRRHAYRVLAEALRARAGLDKEGRHGRQ